MNLSWLLPFAKRPKKRARRDERPEEWESDAAFEPHPSAPSALPGPGLHAAVEPVGLSEPFEYGDPASPAARLDWRASPVLEPTANVWEAGAIIDSGRRRKGSQKAQEPPETKRRAGGAAAPNALRDRLTRQNVDDLRKVMEDPGLATTMSQRIVAEEAGRAALAGNREGFRRSLADLVERLDVTSPKDSAVLLQQQAGLQASSQLQALLGRGKMTMEMTQGGRLLNRVAPMLQKYAGFDIKGDIDGAYSGLSQRFATKAQGAVDVVMGVPEGATGPGTVPGERDFSPAGPAGSGGPARGAAPAAGSGPAGPEGVSLKEGSVPPSGQKLHLGELSSSDEGRVALKDSTSPGGAEKLKVGELPESDSGRIELKDSSSPGGVEKLKVGEVAPEDSGRISLKDSSSPGGVEKLKVGEMAPEDSGRISLKESSSPGGVEKLKVSEMAPQDEGRIALKESSSPGAADKLALGETQGGTGASQLALKEVADTPVAGKLSLREVVAANPDISSVNIQQVTPSATPGTPSILKSLGSVARTALMQKFNIGGEY
jgi:hypothetical protein